MKNRLTARAAAFCATVLIATLAPMPALASPNETPDSSAFISWSAQYGVESEVIAELVAKLESGQLLDSMRSTSEPVETKTNIGSIGIETIATFADGSIVVSSVESPKLSDGKSGLSPQAITGCSLSSSGGYASYSNCRVYSSNGTISVSFYANYSRWSSGASISNWRNPEATANYGSMALPRLNAVRTSAVGAQPAVVTLTSRFTSWNNLQTEDIYLSLRVSPSSAWTTQY